MYSGVSAQSSDLPFSGVVSLAWRILLYHRQEELLLLDTIFPILKLPGIQGPCFILLTDTLCPLTKESETRPHVLTAKMRHSNTSDRCDLIVNLHVTIYSFQTCFPFICIISFL